MMLKITKLAVLLLLINFAQAQNSAITSKASVKQSSTYNIDYAINAIDGKTNTSSSTKWFDKTHWWQIDLGDYYDITSLDLSIRHNNGGTGNHFDFSIIFSNQALPEEELRYPTEEELLKRAEKIITKIEGQDAISLDKPVMARYIQIQPKTTADVLAITEFKIFGNKLENPTLPEKLPWLQNAITSKATVKQSSTYNIDYATNAIDGKLNTSSSTNWFDKTHWWQIDLGDYYDIASLDLNMMHINDEKFSIIFSTQALPTEELRYSTEEELLKRGEKIITKIQGENVIYLEKPVMARYIQIQPQVTATVLSITEFKIFGNKLENPSLPEKLPWLQNAITSKASVKQSSTSDANYVATNAIDGQSTTSSSTKWFESAQWWQIDLGDYYDIASLDLSIRHSNSGTGNNFDFSIIFSNQALPEEELRYPTEEELLKRAERIITKIEGKDVIYLEKPVMARYIQIQPKTTADVLSITEFKIFGNKLENPTLPYRLPFSSSVITQKATVKQSSTSDGNVATNAIDGQRYTYSSTKWFESAQWWQIDLGDYYRISSLNLNLQDIINDTHVGFSVVFSNQAFPEEDVIYPDKLLLQAVEGIVHKQKDINNIHLEQPITARYLRIQPTSSANAVMIYEFDAFGKKLDNVQLANKVTWAELASTSVPFVPNINNKLHNTGAEKAAFVTYGEQMQIAGEYRNNQLMIAFQNHGSNHHVRLASFQQKQDNFEFNWDKKLPNSLERLGGFTADETDFYCLSTVNEAKSGERGWIFRDNIMNLVKFDAQGNEIWTKDMNQTQYVGANQPIYSPMTAGTADIKYGAGKVAVVYAHNTDYDESISSRHQGASRFTVNSTDGTPEARLQGFSAKHSFDQRILFDGTDFTIMDQPDGGWYIVGPGIEVVKINNQTNTHKGTYMGWYSYVRNGDNNYSSINLGNLEVGKDGYLINFVAQKNPTYSNDKDSRNVGLVHMVKNFETLPLNTANYGKEILITPDLIDTKKGNPAATGNMLISTTEQTPGKVQNTGIVWLTNYTLSDGLTATRPKLFKFSDNKYLVAYEVWTTTEFFVSQYHSTKALLIDEYGNILKKAVDVNARLRFRDQLFGIDGKGAWLEFDKEQNNFVLTTFDDNLTIEQKTLQLYSKPYVAHQIQDVIMTGADTVEVAINTVFSPADVNITAKTNDAKVTAQLEGQTLKLISNGNTGTVYITVDGVDTKNNAAQDIFAVHVLAKEESPMLVEGAGRFEYGVGFNTDTVDFTSIFLNSNEDRIRYELFTQNEEVVKTKIVDGKLIFEEVSKGTTEITIKASNLKGAYSLHSFEVYVGEDVASVVSVQTNPVTIYPNPAQEFLTIQLEVANETSIYLFDMNGNEVLYQTSDSALTTLDVSSLGSGVYILKVYNSDAYIHTKIIID